MSTLLNLVPFIPMANSTLPAFLNTSYGGNTVSSKVAGSSLIFSDWPSSLSMQ